MDLHGKEIAALENRDRGEQRRHRIEILRRADNETMGDEHPKGGALCTGGPA